MVFKSTCLVSALIQYSPFDHYVKQINKSLYKPTQYNDKLIAIDT